eukprot:GHVR01044573.1.p1 GENE.GHVR01044573.1~~GHVR01044573.1.p1  ORF type:complete len:199 (-),score=32.32 GHVR01044573.1:291-887(-)
MDRIQSEGTADLADHPYGECRFDMDDDRLTVQAFDQQGRTNLAAYAILRDSRCRFTRRVAEDTVNRSCPALSSVAMVTSINPVPTAVPATGQFMDAAPPATAARETTKQTDPALMVDPPATAAAMTTARETSPPLLTRMDEVQLAASPTSAVVAMAPVVTTPVVTTPMVTAPGPTPMETGATPQPGDGSQILEGEGGP